MSSTPFPRQKKIKQFIHFLIAPKLKHSPTGLQLILRNQKTIIQANNVALLVIQQECAPLFLIFLCLVFHGSRSGITAKLLSVFTPLFTVNFEYGVLILLKIHIKRIFGHYFYTSSLLLSITYFVTPLNTNTACMAILQLCGHSLQIFLSGRMAVTQAIQNGVHNHHSTCL